MRKFKEWLNTAETSEYINDENDVIVSSHTNGELLLGTACGFLGLFAVAAIMMFC